MKKVVPFSKTITFKTMIAEITDIEVKHTLSLTKEQEVEGDILVDGTYKMTDASQIEEEFHYQLPFMIEIDPKYHLEHLEITISDFYFEIINEEDLKINVEIELDGLEEKPEEEIITKITLEEPEILENKEEPILEEELVRHDSDTEAAPLPVELEEETQDVMLTNNPLDQLATEIEQDLQESENVEPTQLEIPKVEVEQMTEQVPYQVSPYKTNIENKPSVSSIFSSISASEETFSTYHVYIVRESDTIESIIDQYKTTKEQLQNYNDLSDVKVGSKLIIPCSNE